MVFRNIKQDICNVESALWMLGHSLWVDGKKFMAAVEQQNPTKKDGETVMISNREDA